jgi:hypothetical protein
MRIKRGNPMPPTFHYRSGCHARADSIISGELPKPIIDAAGKRSTQNAVLLPGLHPRSMIRPGEARSTNRMTVRRGLTGQPAFTVLIRNAAVTPTKK